MNAEMGFSVSLCVFCLFLTIMVLRSGRPSLGLPFAYIAILQLNHVPGAIAHIARPELFETTYFVGIGIWQTAIASLCFSLGLMLSRASYHSSIAHGIRHLSTSRVGSQTPFLTSRVSRSRFLLFCLLGGWAFIYILTPLHRIPSLGAIIEKGGAIWMLGTMLGLRDAAVRSDTLALVLWLSALAVYPTLMLLFGGFLSYGSAAAIIVLSILVVSARSRFRVVVGTIVVAFVGVSLFVNYYSARDTIRSVVWSSASTNERIAVVSDAFKDVRFLDLANSEHAIALHQRLNQNFFAGLATNNLDEGLAEYRGFRQLYEALISPIPRALWPDKPVFGGSGSTVRDMTGLTLSESTSWGVGQVMELYISFGWPSLIVGFAVLGWILGQLDCTAAYAERRGDTKTLFSCFLPAVALIQPLGSLVEIVGGAFAAFFAALGWHYLWTWWISREGYRRSSGDAQR